MVRYWGGHPKGRGEAQPKLQLSLWATKAEACRESSGNAVKHTLQNDPNQGARELGYLYSHRLRDVNILERYKSPVPSIPLTHRLNGFWQPKAGQPTAMLFLALSGLTGGHGRGKGI